MVCGRGIHEEIGAPLLTTSLCLIPPNHGGQAYPLPPEAAFDHHEDSSLSIGQLIRTMQDQCVLLKGPEKM